MRFAGIIFAALSVVGFASTFIVGAALTKRCGVSPAALSILRFAIAGAVMLALGLSSAEGRRRYRAISRRDWLGMLWLGPIGTSVMAWCVFMGCARVSTANASMADALTPLMIFAVAALRRRRIAPRDLLGLALGFIGALLVIQIITRDGIALSAYGSGDVYVMLAAATWGVYTVYGRNMIERIGPSAFTAVTMLAGAAAMAAALPFTETVWPSTEGGWLLVGALGIVSTLLPFWTWNAAQKHLSTAALGVSAYFTPVVAVALALVFLGERATPLQWLGTFFIIASAFATKGRGN